MRTRDVVLITDDNYCLPTLVCIQSVISSAHAEDFELILHVCTFGLSKANKQLLEGLGNERVKVVVESYKDNDFQFRMKQIKQNSHVTPTALIKFELPNCFKYIDTVLYLDSDVIVKGDLTELLSINITDYYLAASYEFWEHLNRIRYTIHRSVDSYFYFNSGVMLMNLKKMREDGIPEKLWQYKLHHAKKSLMDQESLVAVCGESALPLSVKWNFNPAFLQVSYIKDINMVYGSDYQCLADIERDARIVHYVGKYDKPWVYQGATMRSYWDEAYEESRCPIPLLNKKKEVQRHSLIKAVKEKISTQGYRGTLCYLIYLAETKLRR